MDLRLYQKDCVAALWQDLVRRTDSHPLAVLPTGAGKSLIIASMINSIVLSPPARALIVAHRKELLEQNAEKIQAITGLPPKKIGVYCASLNRKDIRDVTLTSIQSAARSPDKFGKINLLLIDEAHLVPKKAYTTYQKLIRHLLIVNPRMRIMGFTATPYRLDSGLLTEGVDALFTHISYDVGMRSLIEQGYLAPLVSRRSTDTEIDTKGVAVRMGDFVQKEISSRVQDIINTALPEIVQLGANRRSWILFFPSVQTAEIGAQVLRHLGIETAIAVTGQTDRIERKRILSEYKKGRIRAICSVDVLTTGFDAPSIDLLVLLRPTKSAALYVQMVGRGSRIFPGKKDCLVLDYGGNIERFGPVDAIETAPSKEGKKKGAPPYRFCPCCGLANLLSSPVCEDDSCGFEFPPPEKGKNMTATASEASILSEPEDWVIEMVRWQKYLKKGKDVPILLLTAYEESKNGALGRKATVALCFEHEGAPRRIALDWWAKNMPYEKVGLPNTVDEANLLMNHWETVKRAKVVKDKKYYRVERFIYGQQ